MRRIFLSGWTDNPGERLYLLTLTAPGDRQHNRSDGTVCPCTPAQGVNLPAWNASAGKRFNHFVTYLRREFGEVQYCRAAEVQKRGALHYHVLMRAAEHAFDGPGTRRLSASSLRNLAIKLGFGHEVDLQVVRSPGAASYCAKYVSKSSADRDQLPWLDQSTGELHQGAPRYRPWSASRHWSSLTMLAIRAQQAAWVQANLSGGQGAAASGAGAALPLGVDGTDAGGLDPKTENYTSGIWERQSPELQALLLAAKAYHLDHPEEPLDPELASWLPKIPSPSVAAEGTAVDTRATDSPEPIIGTAEPVGQPLPYGAAPSRGL